MSDNMEDRLLCIHADRMAARKLVDTKRTLQMTFVKDDAFLTKDRKLAEEKIAAEPVEAADVHEPQA